jgi:hypothetical protein
MFAVDFAVQLDYGVAGMQTLHMSDIAYAGINGGNYQYGQPVGD